MIRIEEKSLLALLEDDPEQGIQILKVKYAEMLRFAASRRLSSPDDVQECVHDTLTDFYLQRRLFDSSKGSLGSYLVAIADRKAIRKYREDCRQMIVAELLQHSFREIDNWEQSEMLRQALDHLSNQDRQIMEMKYYQGLTAREIADALSLEYETVKKRLQRGLKKLLRLMEE